MELLTIAELGRAAATSHTRLALVQEVTALRHVAIMMGRLRRIRDIAMITMIMDPAILFTTAIITIIAAVV
jgi:hypothetical protein